MSWLIFSIVILAIVLSLTWYGVKDQQEEDWK